MGLWHVYYSVSAVSKASLTDAWMPLIRSVPALVFPAACLLYWADRKARRAGEMRVAESLFERRWRAEHGDAKQPNKWDAFKWWCSEMDVVG